jgi:hypothetical protein
MKPIHVLVAGGPILLRLALPPLAFDSESSRLAIPIPTLEKGEA